MNKDRYAGCYSWIKNELENIDVPNIEMVTSGYDLASRNLEDYSFVFIGGGNTYKLLNDLKSSGAFSKLKEYIENKEGIWDLEQASTEQRKSEVGLNSWELSEEMKHEIEQKNIKIAEKFSQKQEIKQQNNLENRDDNQDGRN